MFMRVIIKRKNFSLRPYQISDVFDLAKNLNDRLISRNMSSVPYPYTIKDARKFINRSIKNYLKKKPANMALAIIINNELAGGINIQPQKHMAGLGYWLARKYWGQGIMTEVVSATAKYCSTN